MNSIIFIAPPAAGKGTQSTMLMEKHHMPHISTGDLLRDAVAHGDERGRYIEEQMSSGNLVSDEIIYDLITERLQKEDCLNGYILDGFPRDLEQAYAYERILEKLDQKLGHVIYLEIGQDTAKKRILGRISCPDCGAVYNDMIDHLKPQQDGICDHCHSTLKKRGDDTEETFQKRYETYIKNTEPLLNYYRAKNALITIDSTKDSEEVFAEIEAILLGESK